MRVVAGILLGLLIFFPGVLFLQWVSEDLLGIYRPMTLTDACLVMIIILQSVIIVTGLSRNSTSSAERWLLNGQGVEDEDEDPLLRRRRAARRRPSVRQRIDISSNPGRPRRSR